MPNAMRTWSVPDATELLAIGVSGSRRNVVETGAAQTSATAEAELLRNRDQWERLINTVLIEMGRNHQAFGDEDEGIIAPTVDAVTSACNFAIYARDRAFPAAGQILPDGDGGLVIQRALADGATMAFEAAADGSWAIWFYPRAPQPPVRRASGQPR
jgi:hypothetical protein